MAGLLRRMRADPFLLALIGAVGLATLLPPAGAAAPVAGFLTGGAIVLLFFLHGANLSRRAIVGGLIRWRLHLLVLAITFALFPLLGLALAALPGLDPGIARGMLFIAAVPSTVGSSIAFTAVAGGNVPAAVCAAALSNLTGVFVTPALVTALIGGEGGADLSFAAVLTIVGQLLAPFLAGHALRPLIGGWIGRRKRLISLFDRGAILLIVYVAFGAAVIDGIWARTDAVDLVLITGLCAALLAAVLLLSTLAGRLLGFAREDRIVIQFCGSKKSLVAGVPLAGVLFPPATVGAVILPLMVFHQLQLFVCAVIARHHANAARQIPADDCGRAAPVAWREPQ